MGSLRLYAGPMFSGKTSVLLECVSRANEVTTRVVVAQPAPDDQPRTEIVSHAGNRHPAVCVVDAAHLSSIADGAELLLVDEAQFLAEGTASILRAIADAGVDVITAGLDLDFRGDPFATVSEISSAANTVVVLTAVCSRCGSVATRTQRFLGPEPAPFDSARIVLGGHEIYAARCERCWLLERNAM
jgi:thymidine kinase